MGTTDNIINIYGTGGHALVIKDIIEAAGNKVGLFYDDNPHSNRIDGIPALNPKGSPVIGPLILGIGSNDIRAKIAAKHNVFYARAVHPSAIVSPSALLGEGSVVMHGAIVQAKTRIGRHCIVNTGASIDHECRIADFVHISPHATLCGNVCVGERSWIGAGAVVIQGVKIGADCMIAAGAVVIRDVPDRAVVAGVPAKAIDTANTSEERSFPEKASYTIEGGGKTLIFCILGRYSTILFNSDIKTLARQNSVA